MKTINSIVKFTKNATTFILVVTLFGYFYNLVATVNAAESLATVVGRIESNVLAISRLLILISYIAGVGFAMAGVLQFKAHKDNPTQVPLSKPIVFVCVGAFLLFLPKLMDTAGKSIFGADGVQSPSGATDITQIKSDSGN